MSLDKLSRSLNKGFLAMLGMDSAGRSATGDIYEFGKLNLNVKTSPRGVGGKAFRGAAMGAAAATGLSLITGEDYSVSGFAVGGAFASTLAAGLPSMSAASSMPYKGVGAFLGPAVALGTSAYFIANGYRENGMQGAKDAAVMDLAINTGMWLGVRGVSLKTHGAEGITERLVHKGPVRLMGRAVMASMGASIGNALGGASGIPGAEMAGTLLGGMLGGAPMRMISRHPLLVIGAIAGMAAGTGVKMIGKGTSQIVSMANSHQKMRRTIQTDGSLAAFMTEGATTMRSRSIQAIQKSHMNARSALGREANFMHYPSRNYHSQYRM